MNEYLHHLQSQLPQLISSTLFEVADPVAVLDARDAAEFESEWLRVHHALASPDTASSASISEVERAAFERVYAACGATDFTELAPAVSEDFGLFARALCRGFSDPWLSGLLSSYQRGVFPSGHVQPVSSPLPALLSAA